MELFLDTGIVDEIRKAAPWGIVDGVTTNPSLIAKSGRTQIEVIHEITALIDGPISAEVIATDFEGMIKEGKELSKMHKNIVIKVPMTEEGIRACRWFSENDIKTNLTLVFSSNQALLAAKSGATFVSPFIGRLDDCGQDGMSLIGDIRTVFDNYNFSTKILAASLRHPTHVRDAALIGADIGTMPFKVMKAMFKHPLTDKGLAAFIDDYNKSTKNLV